MRGTIERVMTCPCPPEELRATYEGGAEPIPGRFVCALCGEYVYATEAGGRYSTTAYRASASSSGASTTAGSSKTRVSQSGRVFATIEIG